MPYHPPIPDSGQDDKSSGKRPSGLISALIQAEKLVQVALILPCAAFIGWLGGDWLGHRLNQPWLAALGVVFGGAAGLVYVVRLALNAVNDPANADEDTSGKEDPGKRS
jgi:hypothetical protein